MIIYLMRLPWKYASHCLTTFVVKTNHEGDQVLPRRWLTLTTYVVNEY